MSNAKGLTMTDANQAPLSADDIVSAAEVVPGLVEKLVAGDIQAMKDFLELSGQKVSSITVSQVQD